MAQFTTLTSRVMPLPVNDIDTDQIIPAQFLKVTDKNGLADALFFNWRYNDDKTPKADFILNQPSSKGAQILLAGDNFGCGSSREHAPWALTSYGFRKVLHGCLHLVDYTRKPMHVVSLHPSFMLSMIHLLWMAWRKRLAVLSVL